MTDELTNSEPTATTWKSRGSNFLRRTRMTRRRLALFLAVVGLLSKRDRFGLGKA